MASGSGPLYGTVSTFPYLNDKLPTNHVIAYQHHSLLSVRNFPSKGLLQLAFTSLFAYLYSHKVV